MKTILIFSTTVQIIGMSGIKCAKIRGILDSMYFCAMIEKSKPMTDTPKDETNQYSVAIQNIQVLSDHYKETFDQTVQLWNQRNRIFVYLVLVIGVTTLLRLQIPEANSLFVDMLVGILNIQDAHRINNLQNTFPFDTLQTILLIVIFYLMVNLYHRAFSVLRNYRYLSGLEKEMRTILSLPSSSMYFTRESSFYWKDRPWFLGTVKYFYFGIVGILLFIVVSGPVSHILGKIPDSIATVDIFDIVNLFLVLAIIAYYGSYVYTSLILDRSP